MKRFLLTTNKKANGFLIVILLLLTNVVMSQVTGDYRSANNNVDWSALASWERYNGSAWVTPTSGQGYPGQNTGTGNVIIRFGGSINLDVSPANAIGSLNVGDGTANNLGISNAAALLSISSFTLTVTGNVTVSDSNGSRNGTLNNGSGTVKCGGSFSGNGSYAASTGTFEYNGSAQTLAATTYNNLTLSNSGSKTISGVTVNGILSMEGTATASAAPTYGTTATLQYNTTTARTITGAANNGIEWIATFLTGRTVRITNTGAITLSTARTFNSGSTLIVNSGATFILAATLTNSGTTTFNGTFQINSGNLTAAPIYGSSSTLIYNTSYGRFNEWSATGSGTIGTTPGYPNNVTIQNGATLSLANGSNTDRALAGNLTLGTGTTSNGLLTMEAMTGRLIVGGNVVIGGNTTSNTSTLTLSSNVSSAGIELKGNWTRTPTRGTFAPNGRGVLFTGTGTQTVSITGGGTANFDFLLVQNTSSLRLDSSPNASNVTVSSASGLSLSSSATNTIDLNGQTMTLSGGGNLLLNNGSRNITSTVSGGIFSISTSNLAFLGGGTSGLLSFGANVRIETTTGLDFGTVNNAGAAALTTVNGTFRINSGGGVSNASAPIWASGSTLNINNGSNYGIYNNGASQEAAGWFRSVASTGSAQWGIPWNFTVSGSGTNVFYNAVADGFARHLNGSVDIQTGATFSLGGGSGMDLFLRGNWSRNGTFNNTSRKVTFNGTSSQTINNATTFFDLIDSNTTSALTFGAVVTVSNNLSVATSASLNLGTLDHTANSLTLGGSGTASGFWGSTTSSATNTNNTYFAATTGRVNVSSNTCASFTATMSGTATICNGGSANIAVTITGGLSPYDLVYTSAAGNVTVNNYISGSAITVTPSSTSTYTIVSVTNTNRCSANLSGSAVITVNQPSVAPTSISGTTTICSGSPTTLTAVGGTLGTGANYQWGTGAVVGTSPLSGETASTLTISPSSSTTYWVRIESTTSPCTANTSGVTQLVTVNQPSVAPTSISGTTTICNGGSTTLTAVGGTLGTGATYQWGTGAVVGTSPLSGETASTLTISPSSSTTYWVRIESTTSPCIANTTGVTQLVTVNQPSVAPTSITGTTTICNGGSTTLTAVGGTLGTGANYQWGTGAVVGTSPLSGETASTLTISPSSSTTYWVRIESTTSPCTANTTGVSQLVTVNTLSVAPTGATGTTTICYGGNTTLTVDGGSAGTGAVAEWFTGSCGGTSAGTGNSINVSPTSTTTYYVRYTGTCNTTTCGTVTVTISTANTWTGGTSTAWNTATNWSCGVVPASVSDVTISTASNYPEISSNVTINTLTLDSGTTLKVNSSSNLTVTDVIDNDGTLTIENNGNLLQVNNVANTGSGSTIVKRNSSALKRLDYTLWSSPVTGQGLYAFSKFTFANRFYKYVTSTNFYNNSLGFSITGLNGDGVNGTDTNNVPFNTGQGYLIRMPWNHPTAATVWNGQFTGVPNNGNYGITISDSGSGFRYNLIGNPYPSPISAVSFVAANRQSGDERITGVLYFWRETNNTTANNAYCSWSPAGGGNGTFVSNSQPEVYDLNGVIQTGQGFIVEAESGASQVNFNNSMRVNNTAGQFFRTNLTSDSDADTSRIWLNVTNTTGLFCQTALGYMTDATMAFDGGVDGRLINDGEIALYSTVGNESLVIQGRALPFDANDVVPLGLRITNSGNYAISIDHVDGLFSQGQIIYLRDNLTSTIHDLTTGAYNFNSDAGTFNSRFEVIYQLPLGVGTPTFNSNQVVIHQNEAHDFVINTGNIVMSSVKVFDIRGRLLLNVNDINATQTIITAGQVNQVLLVQITSEEGLVVTKKVIR